MSIGGALLLKLLETALSAAVDDFMKESTHSLIHAFFDRVTQLSTNLGGTEKDRLLKLINEDESVLSALIAQLKRADRRGMLLLGPSGGGKTELFNALTNRISKERRSTIEVDDRFLRLGGKIRSVHDTMGQEDNLTEMFTTISYYEPTTVVFVASYGYLDTVDTGDELRRPPSSGIAPPPGGCYATLPKYLKATREEEFWWLSVFTQFVARPKPNRRVRYIVLAVNKMDLWADKYDAVMDYYKNQKFADKTDGGREKTFVDKLEELAGKVGIAAHKIQVVGVSAYHDNFKTSKSSVKVFKRKATDDSVRIMKAFLAGLMIEGNL
jgi:hypothetical protein